MKLTKEMERLIDRRAKLALELNNVSFQIDNFIMENKMENEIEEFDWQTGCEIYVNPMASALRIKDAIRKH